MLGVLKNGFKLDRPIYAGEMWRIEYKAPETENPCVVTLADHMCENQKEHYFLEVDDVLVTNGIIDNIDYPAEYIKFISMIGKENVDKAYFIASYRPS